MDNRVTRRTFVGVSAAAVAPLVLTRRGLARAAANDRANVAIIGTGKRAFEMLGTFLDSPDLQVVAVCDVDKTRREHAKAIVDKKYGTTDCEIHVDYRPLVNKKSIDAVVICTPDHWHANQVMEFGIAGKDIYCEKPLSLNLRECKSMIDAVKASGIVLQTGSQQRTEFGGKFRTACEYVRSGRIGSLLTVHVGVGLSSKPCDLPEEPMEPGLNWDLWLGPAPVRPYNSILSPRGVHTHYPKWRDYREYSGGGLTDMGAHNFDIAHWGMGMDESGPVEVIPPPRETDVHGATLVYSNGVRVIHGGPDGITFTGTKGQIHVFRDRLSSIPDSILKEPLKDTDVTLPVAKGQIQNWIDCMKGWEHPICGIEVGARSIACAHLCNLAYWHRRPLKWDPAKWEFPGDTEANGWRDYQRREEFELPRL